MLIFQTGIAINKTFIYSNSEVNDEKLSFYEFSFKSKPQLCSTSVKKSRGKVTKYFASN